ncbi:hypothetical protein [Actinoplanes aureus]|uniref:hypothetical protein n=1 Tax=Actinoplanes aureus TaxID=2792083 RepID=UPI001E45B1F4|nr:hypothetical protein [Actinoplanes aureus]
MTVARAQRASGPNLGAAAFLDSAVVHMDLPQAVFDAMLEGFDATPARVTHELNLIRHKGDYEGRPDANRPLSRAHLDKFFGTVDARARNAAEFTAKAHRDAALFLSRRGRSTCASRRSGTKRGCPRT